MLNFSDLLGSVVFLILGGFGLANRDKFIVSTSSVILGAAIIAFILGVLTWMVGPLGLVLMVDYPVKGSSSSSSTPSSSTKKKLEEAVAHGIDAVEDLTLNGMLVSFASIVAVLLAILTLISRGRRMYISTCSYSVAFGLLLLLFSFTL
ncbi:hypothetical protein Gasu2_33540 [Galdieria sulphuraria]|nr:hypothetical protein Gasu2_33540 [Galdieria sulphuraria]